MLDNNLRKLLGKILKSYKIREEKIMAEAVIMPRQGQSVESCLVTSVNKKKGDNVNSGDILFSYETDKSSFEEEAKVEGIVLEILVEEGEEVPCLEPVMIIGQAGEDISALLPKAKPAETETAEIVEAETETAEISEPEEKTIPPDALDAPPAVVADESEFKMSLRAKSYAERARVDLSKVVPTGPNGRIIERDIIKAVNQGYRLFNEQEAPEPEEMVPQIPADTAESDYTDIPAASEYTDVKLPNIRRIIAKAMHASLSEMAQLTLNSSFDASAILTFRKSLKDSAQVLALENITLNDIILYATAKTLKNHKDLNAHYLGDVIRYFDSVNLGVAVDTERGLVVPTIFGADALSLNELSKAAKLAISEAQSGAIDPDKLKNGTFTVTNLGTLGVESFTPVINPPQTAILGVNNITRRVKQVNGQDIFYDCMSLSLTFDHRALDGAPAARFLKDLCAGLENFDSLLAK
jgi:pyruvate dehydrogenase E2 component (dihydrolipoamide acetyltransferase)